jgi:single-stranded-DNA-specific exonuclease
MHWSILQPDTELVTRLKKEFRTSTAVARVLANRGITSLEEARPFFNPKLDHLHPPFLMKDMEPAVERILKNIRQHKPILIFGDYDVDGTTAASMLYLTLAKLGAEAHTYIPNREQEGYGLSLPGIQYAQSVQADLIITCDCGINAFEQVDYAQQQGIDVIITDHHTPATTLPNAAAILNPKRSDCAYPFKGLCGGGVAFKLAQALWDAEGREPQAILTLLDLLTLGTAADMVPLLDENRVMVRHGLEQIRETRRPGIRALLKMTGLEGKSLTVGQIVFGLAPRINAAGRMGNANRVVTLLTTEDPHEAFQLTNELDQENQRRQKIQKAVIDEALLLVNAEVDLERDRTIVLQGHGWHPGVVGIVASHIKEIYYRPTVIISIDENGLGKGSARSIPGFDLYQALTNVREYLEGYGGHPMAAGLTLQEENIPKFREALLEYANQQLTPDDLIPTLTIDSEINLTDINGRFMDFLEKLGPYGPGNMRPKFVAREVEIVGHPRLVGHGEHLRFRARQRQSVYTAIGFNMAQHYEDLITGYPVDLAFVVEINEWQGTSSIQLNIRDIKRSSVQ